METKGDSTDYADGGREESQGSRDVQQRKK